MKILHTILFTLIALLLTGFTPIYLQASDDENSDNINPDITSISKSGIQKKKDKCLLPDINNKLSSTSVEVKMPSKKIYKSMLIVGEGNFSYTESLLNKRKEEGKRNIAGYIWATEYKKEKEVSDDVMQRVKRLEYQGVHIKFGVDGTALRDSFNRKRFPRFEIIQWNYPHNTEDYETRGNKKTVESFFKSASKLQKKGDRIHITLALGTPNQFDYKIQDSYGIDEALKGVEYQLIKARKFDEKRYPGYIFQAARQKEGANYKNKGNDREYIFEKTKNTSEKKIEKYNFYPNFSDDEKSDSDEYYSKDYLEAQKSVKNWLREKGGNLGEEIIDSGYAYGSILSIISLYFL